MISRKADLRPMTVETLTSMCRRKVPVLLCGLLSWLAAERAQAMPSYSYDLDSVVYMSTDIVEGKLVRSYKEGQLDLDEIQITGVHKGGMKPGQLVAVCYLNLYGRRAADIPYNNVPLVVGDSLVLFLEKAQHADGNLVPVDGHFYRPVDSAGVKLIEGGKVEGISRDNPGPYVVETPTTDPGKSFPTVPEFDDLIRLSIQKTDALAVRFQKEPAAEDIPWLLQLLREGHYEQKYVSRDHIAELAAARLARLHDPGMLDEALRPDLPWECAIQLWRGFGTPSGREFVLRKLADDREPEEKRIQYTGIAMVAISDAPPATAHASTASLPSEAGLIPGEPGYATRIAQIALDHAGQEKFCQALLQCVDECTWDLSHKPEPTRKDVKQASAILKKLYDAVASEALKYQIEETTARVSREAYDALGSKCGRIISIVYRDSQFPSASEKGMLHYTSHSINLDGLPVDKTPIILVNQETGRTYELRAQFAFSYRGAKDGGGPGMAILPADLPHGKYRVFYQFEQGGKVISEGHYFEADL